MLNGWWMELLCWWNGAGAPCLICSTGSEEFPVVIPFLPWASSLFIHVWWTGRAVKEDKQLEGQGEALRWNFPKGKEQSREVHRGIMFASYSSERAEPMLNPQVCSLRVGLSTFYIHFRVQATLLSWIPNWRQ